MYNVVVQWNVGNGDTHPQTQRTSDKRKSADIDVNSWAFDTFYIQALYLTV